MWSEYAKDHDNLPIPEFNKKWEIICKVSQVAVIYKTTGGTKIVSHVMLDDVINNIYNAPPTQRYLKAMKDKYSLDHSLGEFKLVVNNLD